MNYPQPRSIMGTTPAAVVACAREQNENQRAVEVLGTPATALTTGPITEVSKMAESPVTNRPRPVHSQSWGLAA